MPVFSFSISHSLTFPLSKISNLPCPLTSTPSYSPFLVVWLSLPSPLTHTFPFLLDSQGILTNSEDFLRTCFRRQIVFGSGPLLEPLVLGYRPWWVAPYPDFLCGQSAPCQPLMKPSSAIAPTPSPYLEVGPIVIKLGVTPRAYQAQIT